MNVLYRLKNNIDHILGRWRSIPARLKAGRFDKAFSPERSRRVRTGLVIGLSLLLGSGGIALAGIIADVANTRHNLSASNPVNPIATSSFGPNVVKATSETQICVFCHTPHGATSSSTTFVAPLWNRALNTLSTYTFYTSSSLDANPLPGAINGNQPGIGSKLCLSCHDGTLAIGTVGVLNNQPGNIAMEGTETDGTMPAGTKGAATGFTRRIDIDLSNDHPISFTYNSTQAGNDGELYSPGESTNVLGGISVDDRAAARAAGRSKPQFPLVKSGTNSYQLECITCHDPHLRSEELDEFTSEPINNKFLRGNRFQLASPTPNTIGRTAQYDPTKDIMCLACHNKPTWATSTHANEIATSERYKSTDSDLRDFPRGIRTWQAACANCHDMHTVPGSRRLLREGTASTASPKIGGSKPAIEQVCFQCHSPGADRILVQEAPDQVPDIKTDFSLPVHMPIVTAEQGWVPEGGGTTGNTEVIHDIGKKETPPDGGALDLHRGKDFIEPRSLMGNGSGKLINRHAECTDCHQPHRVTRTVLFNGDPTIKAEKGTHRHGGTNDVGGVPHNNLASGSQRGQFGVEPVYGSDSFYDEPVGFIEKRGPVDTAILGATAVLDPTIGDYAVTNTYLTREYQVCAKCHSNYAFGPQTGSINNPSNIPALGRTGGTPSGTNGMRFYTNVFREIQAPDSQRGELAAAPPTSGAFNEATDPPPYTLPYIKVSPSFNFLTNNHRSWHPVMRSTGRTLVERGNIIGTNWLPPWDADVGVQTMYCTDCHGSETPPGLSKHPPDGSPEGPHGSNNIFLLKGWWDQCTGIDSNLQGCLDSANTSTTTVVTNANLNPPVFRPGASSSTQNDLCFKCHSYRVYGAGGLDGADGRSGFSGTDGVGDNGHKHYILGSTVRCMWCHVAVPHGWKNKALLVNLNDVGPEATCRQEDADDAPDGYKCTDTVGLGNPMPKGTQVRNGPLSGSGLDPQGPNFWAGRGYSNPPYYRNALLKITSFAKSGNWARSNCGSVGLPGDGKQAGCGGWMQGDEGCGGVP